MKSMPSQAARVDEVLRDLGLTDASNTLIGNWFLKAGNAALAMIKMQCIFSE